MGLGQHKSTTNRTCCLPLSSSRSGPGHEDGANGLLGGDSGKKPWCEEGKSGGNLAYPGQGMLANKLLQWH